MDLFTLEVKHAFAFKKISDQKNIESLSDVFEEISKAASEGKYEVNIKKDLTGVQQSLLESLDFYIYEYSEDAEEYEKGLRFSIDWEDATDPNEEE